MENYRKPDRGIVDQRALAGAMRLLEKSHDDARVSQALAGGAQVVDALNGNPVTRHVYRLDCGHLTDVHGTKLPNRVTHLYCERERCRRERRVSEWLTAY